MWKNYRNGSCSGGYVQNRFHRAQVQGFVNHDVHWKGKKAFLNGKYWNCGNFFSCSWKYVETEQVTIFFFFNEWTSNLSKVCTPQGQHWRTETFLEIYPRKFRVKSRYNAAWPILGWQFFCAIITLLQFYRDKQWVVEKINCKFIWKWNVQNFFFLLTIYHIKKKKLWY